MVKEGGILELRNGIDLVEIDRIAHSMEHPRFLQDYFSPDERILFLERGNAPQSVAANFAAKEAFAKALGCGVSGFGLTEVSVLRDAQGAPYLTLTGRAAALATGWRFAVSLSHSRTHATAVITAWQD